MSPVVVPRSNSSRPRCQFNVEIEPGLKSRITLLAARRGCFKATLVREALEALLASAESKGRLR